MDEPSGFGEVEIASRTYRVDSFAYLFAVATVAFTVFGVVFFVQEVADGGKALVGAALPFAILGWFWFNVLFSPFRIRIDAGGTVEFRALARRVEVPASRIQRIKGHGYQTGAVVYADRVRVWLRVMPRDTFDFLTRLRRLNPDIVIEKL